MDKMQMAHEMALAMANDGNVPNENIIAIVWAYADAMQAEADKRKPSGLPDALKEEWQPDWSQAPDEAKYWMITPNGSAGWLSDHPLSDPLKIKSWYAPSFGYTGNWKDSLRERP